MFTLYKLTDIKGRLSDAVRVLTKNFGQKTNVITVQTDVTQMYTNLNHEQIRDALIWMCDRARNQYNKHKRKQHIIQNILVYQSLWTLSHTNMSFDGHTLKNQTCT